MEHVPHAGHDNHLEAPLHLADHELFVEAVRPREYEQTRSARCQKGGGEALEPTWEDWEGLFYISRERWLETY